LLWSSDSIFSGRLNL